MPSAELEPTKALWNALHAHAERSGHEQETAEIVASFLEDAGLHVERDVGGHGLLVTIGEGPYRLLRAELDGVPQGDGARHGCGHDGHMAMLAGALVELREASGVAALFQPAEEDGSGMAKCLEDPRLGDLDVHDAFAIHNTPGEPLGQVILGPGALASTGVRVDITGREAHAALPHEGHSPYTALRALADHAMTLQHPDGLATLIHMRLGDEAYGTSPGKGRVAVTLRGTAQAVARLRHDWLDATPTDLDSQITDVDPFPETRNHKESLEAARQAANDAGLEIGEQQAPWPWSEDFGHAVAKWGGALIGLGSGVDQPPLHDDDYTFPTELLRSGIRFWTALGGQT